MTSGTRDFLRLLVGELGTLKSCPKFRLWQMTIYPYRMLLHGASDLDQRCLKMCSSENECTFPPNIFAPAPKITRKPHFWGTFNAKPIIQTTESHPSVATTLKLYGYIGIGKYFGVCQNVFARGRLGEGARPVNVNFGPKHLGNYWS